MAIVTYVLGDCPQCGRAESFGNVDVFSGAVLYQACKVCNYHVRVPLPRLKKKIIYLDQFFFSHAFRGQDQRFLDAVAKIERISSLQLLVAPYSSVHEDETHLWSGREQLFRFIKSVSRGHQFRFAQEVHRFQLIRAFKAWRAAQRASFELEEGDALSSNVHGWDSYLRIDVGRYIGNIDLIRSLKNQSVEGLVGLFDGWRQLTTTFDDDVQAEYAVAGRGYIDVYLEYFARMASGDHSALLNAPVTTMVVESMVHALLHEGVRGEECLRICAEFLVQSDHFKQVPYQYLSARMHATLKSMVKSGHYTNKQQALRKLKGYFYDVEHISTYAPYCHAFVMDQAMADLVRQATVGLEARFGTKVFTVNNWRDFFEWLDSLERDIQPSHRAGLAAAYPGRMV